MIFNDHKVLDEAERKELADTVETLERLQVEKYITQPERLLVRAAEHIEVQDQRIANLSGAYQVTEKDNDRLRAGLEKMVLALQEGDRTEAIEILEELGFGV